MRFFFPLLLFFIVYLMFVFFDYSSIHQWMKPFLIPSLLFFYLINLKGKPQLKLIGALLLSAAGDAFLMFNGPDFFISGLVAFLFAHILYVFIFKSFLKRLIINRFILLCSFLIGLYYVLLMRFWTMFDKYFYLLYLLGEADSKHFCNLDKYLTKEECQQMCEFPPRRANIFSLADKYSFPRGQIFFAHRANILPGRDKATNMFSHNTMA